MKKWFASIVGLLTVLFVLSACQKGSTATTASTSGTADTPVTLRLGVMPSTDNIPFIIAQQQKFDTGHGVKLELEVFKSALDRDAALTAGKLDGVITDLVALAIYQEAGLATQVVAAPYDQFDLVSGDPAVKSVADLAGKDVIFSQRTGTAYAVAQILATAKMKADDINPVEIPQVPLRLEMLANKQATAAILPEPFVTMAKAQGMHVVKSTRDLGINPFAIVFTTEAIEKNGPAIAGLFDAYNEAAAYVTSHDKADYIQLFVDEVGFPASLIEQIEVPDYGKLTQVKVEDVQAAFAFAREHQLLTKEINEKDLISNVYFK